MQKSNMLDLMHIIETSIDRLIAQWPLTLLMDFPQLAILISNPNGRYVIAGLAVVFVMLGLWVFLRVIQIILGGGTKQSSKTATDGGQAVKDRAVMANNAGVGMANSAEFQFFRRDSCKTAADDNADLAAIEQEMLAVRQLYADGHILKDVYVAETRRLYGKAKALQT